MSSVIQHLRRINGAVGSPPTQGAYEGQIAFNAPGAPGGTEKPAVHFFDGIAWRLCNPDVTVTTGTATLPGGTPGSATGVGAAWTALVSKPTGNLIVVSYGGGAYLLTGAGGSDTDWTSLGSATAFASPAEILVGTDNSKAINSQGLRSASVSSPSAVQTNDAAKFPILNSNGKLDAGFLPISGGVQFLTAHNVSFAPPAVPGGFQPGMFIAHSGPAGNVEAGWAGAAGKAVDSGDMLLYDGTIWHVIESVVDLSAYVKLAGTNIMSSTAQIKFTAAAAKRVVIDGGALKDIIDNVTLDAGSY